MRRRRPRKTDQVLLLLGAASLLAVHHSARATDYYVDPGDQTAYATIQAAVDAVSGQSELNRANIFIAPGKYHEIVTVTKPFIGFIGTGAAPSATTISFSQAYLGGDLGDGAVIEIQNTAVAFMACNLAFENSLPDKNISAALALRSS